MIISIQFDTENDAFVNEDGSLREEEVMRILGQARVKVMKQLHRPEALCNAPEADDKLLDVNGNTCGWVTVSRE